MIRYDDDMLISRLIIGMLLRMPAHSLAHVTRRVSITHFRRAVLVQEQGVLLGLLDAGPLEGPVAHVLLVVPIQTRAALLGDQVAVHADQEVRARVRRRVVLAMLAWLVRLLRRRHDDDRFRRGESRGSSSSGSSDGDRRCSHRRRSSGSCRSRRPLRRAPRRTAGGRA